MAVQSLEVVLREHPFMKGLPAAYIETVVGCAQNRKFSAGEYLSRADEQADTFYLIRTGTVALEVYTPNKGGLRVDTVEEGEVLGWSWLVAPYKWQNILS